MAVWPPEWRFFVRNFGIFSFSPLQAGACFFLIFLNTIITRFRIGICRIILCFCFFLFFLFFVCIFCEITPKKKTGFFLFQLWGLCGFENTRKKIFFVSVFFEITRKKRKLPKNDELHQIGDVYHCGKSQVARKPTFYPFLVILVNFLVCFDVYRSARLDGPLWWFWSIFGSVLMSVNPPDWMVKSSSNR